MSKVAVVGAGAVGTAIAYAAQIRGVCRQLALFDLNARKVRAEVLDLNHGMQFTPMAQITGSDDLAVCAGADVVVITAGAKQKPGQTRLDLAAANVAMCRDLVPALVGLAPDALLLVVTNPVDVVTYAVQQLSGLPAHRVFGSGTVLDSSRLRFLIAEHTGVAVQNVHAYIAGEHGDSEVPLWSTATIGGVPVQDWGASGERPSTRRPGPDPPPGRHLGLRDHRRQGRDQPRHRARRLARPRGRAERRAPRAAGDLAARRGARALRRVPVDAVGRRAGRRREGAGHAPELRGSGTSSSRPGRPSGRRPGDLGL